MRVLLFALTAALLLPAVLSQVAGQEKTATDSEAADSEATEEEKFDFWMNVKLLESQKLFAALSRADFEALRKSSETLETLNAIEGFVRRRTPGYSTQLQAFEFAVNEIKKQAKLESIEGAALGFQQLTLSCVNCHKDIRETAN